MIFFVPWVIMYPMEYINKINLDILNMYCSNVCILNVMIDEALVAIPCRQSPYELDPFILKESKTRTLLILGDNSEKMAICD